VSTQKSTECLGHVEVRKMRQARRQAGAGVVETMLPSRLNKITSNDLSRNDMVLTGLARRFE